MHISTMGWMKRSAGHIFDSPALGKFRVIIMFLMYFIKKYRYILVELVASLTTGCCFKKKGRERERARKRWDIPNEEREEHLCREVH